MSTYTDITLVHTKATINTVYITLSHTIYMTLGASTPLSPEYPMLSFSPCRIPPVGSLKLDSP